MARAFVFAHYDCDGMVDDYVVDAIRKYRRLTDRLILVSSSASALPQSISALVDTFVPRPNIGYDFCSWKAGIESLGAVDHFDELICVNDSVYGPLFDLGPVLAKGRRSGADFWGMCRSQQGTKRRGTLSCPHIQSWFFAMRRPLLVSRAFSHFWNAVVPLPSKDSIIDHYEIGMSEHFARSGFSTSAIYDAGVQMPAIRREILSNLSVWEPARSWRHLRKARKRPSHNPSELFPLHLIEGGVPFVKIGLFRKNHYGLNLGRVLDHIRTETTYDTGWIANHLARTGRELRKKIGR